MRLVQLFLVLGALSPQTAVFIKGHSHAAEIARDNIQTLTCYSSARDLESSIAVLEVDHVVARSGRRWIVMVLTDRRNHVLYSGKLEENPWPFPSPSARLLRNMAKSTCSEFQTSRSVQAPAPERPVAFTHP